MRETSIPVQRLHQLFDLADDGRLFNKAKRAYCVSVGAEAGWDQGGGRRQVAIGGVRVYSYRVVWAMTHGRWPSQMIDHIDGNPANNHPSNLREATAQVNGQNRHKAACRNTSGVMGVFACRGNYRATIRLFDVDYYLGEYRTAADAGDVYRAAKRTIHPGAAEFSEVQNACFDSIAKARSFRRFLARLDKAGITYEID